MSEFDFMSEITDKTPREKLLSLEDSIRELDQVDLPLQHFFTNGMYARQMFLPAGTVLTGKIHLDDHIFMLQQGDMSIYSTETESSRIQAPFICVSKAGVKRAGFAHADSVVTTIHQCTTENVEEAEEMLAVDTFEEYEQKLLENQL